ncbi:MAG: undecaprenyl-diphosphate phosphatase [Candidatus Bathyarchaeia archaeon]
MNDAIIIGFLQGLLEWLPVSSKSMIILYLVNAASVSGETAYSLAMFLHFSTATAALIMFRSDFLKVMKYIVHREYSSYGDCSVLFRSLLVTIVISAAIGLPLYLLTRYFILELSGLLLTCFIGVFLILTGLFLKYSKSLKGVKSLEKIGTMDMVLAGFMQGLSALPGLSRSGLVASTLLMRNVEKETAFRLTFIISVPIIYGMAIAEFVVGLGFRASLEEFGTINILIALATSFILSLISLRMMLELARRLDFTKFLIFFGSLTFGLSLVTIMLS